MNTRKHKIEYKFNFLYTGYWIVPAMLFIIAISSSIASIIYSSPIPFFITLSFLLLIPTLFLGVYYLTPRVLLGIFILSRLILDSVPEITYKNIVGSLSIMKLYSAGIIAFGIFYLIRKRETRLDWLLALFALILFTSLATTIYHQNWVEFLETFLKWSYLWLIISLTRLAVNEGDFKHFAIIIILCYSYSIINFFYSVIVGKLKCASDICRFIGTYSHQSGFSFIMLALVPAALYLMIIEKKFIIKFIYATILLLAHIGIYSASYRTTWVALVLYWFIFLVLFQKAIHMQKRIIISFFLFIIVGAILIPGSYVGERISERLSPVATLLQEPSKYFGLYSSEAYRSITGHPYVDEAEENLFLSGRIGAWKSLIISYREAPIEEKVLGMGVGRDKDMVARYKRGHIFGAHNIYIETLIETGILGLIALLSFIIIVLFKIISRLKQPSLVIMIATPIFFSYIIVGVTENALDDIRGILCLGLYLGVAIYYVCIDTRELQASKSVR